MEMNQGLEQIISAYDPKAPLERAVTIPSDWYTDSRVFEREQATVFAHNWFMAGRLDQLSETGRFVTADVAGEPIVVVRGRDHQIRAFYNVCRHHAAEVATGDAGCVGSFRCPYHGWTYDLAGALKGTPEFGDAVDFDKSQHGLRPVAVEAWENFVFVRLSEDGLDLTSYLGGLVDDVSKLALGELRFVERRTYRLRCNWKVFVDNFLDGGYHVPHIHKGLGSVLDYTGYGIENRDRYCVQTSPVVQDGADAQIASVRRGDMAYYYWLYPNFMLNWYEGYLDTNLVLPVGLDETVVLFDFYMAPEVDHDPSHVASSVAVAERVQQEDIDVCESVQRGLRSRAYDVGRLSVRREAGEQFFHRLLYDDLKA